MSQNPPENVKEVASHALFGRLLFVYARAGQIQCYSADEIRGKESSLLEYGWKHTATIDPARWIEAMANNGGEPSDMLDELQFCPPNVDVLAPAGEKTPTKKPTL